MLDRTWQAVKSSDPCRFVVLGEVSHVTRDGGLQDFPGVADVIHWNEGKVLDPLERSSDVRAQNIVLRDNVEAGICPTWTFVRQTVRKFADICPTRTFVRQSHLKCILKTISRVKGAISGDYR